MVDEISLLKQLRDFKKSPTLNFIIHYYCVDVELSLIFNLFYEKEIVFRKRWKYNKECFRLIKYSRSSSSFFDYYISSIGDNFNINMMIMSNLVLVKCEPFHCCKMFSLLFSFKLYPTWKKKCNKIHFIDL